MNLTPGRRKDLNEIFNYYGLETQHLKLIEELGELISALATGTTEEVITEIADVEIMLEQYKDGVRIRHKVGAEEEYKINRQLCRIGKNNPFKMDCASAPVKED